MDALEALERLHSAARQAEQVFTAHKSELTDLRSSFWVNLRDVVEWTDPTLQPSYNVLRPLFHGCRVQLGAPGDFGYGTPCGDALRDLYGAWGVYCDRQIRPEPASR